MAKGLASVLLGIVLAVAVGSVALAQEDREPPLLVDVSFEPEVFDTGNGPVTVTVTIRVRDDLSGFHDGWVTFALPDTTQTRTAQIYSGDKPIEGDNLDGVYAVDMVLPQYSGYGVWGMSEYALVDNVGNRISMTKPSEENGLLDSPEWPSLYNQFEFVVGSREQAAQPVVWIPLATSH